MDSLPSSANPNGSPNSSPLPNDGLAQPTVETAVQLGLLPEEFENIREILGRVPNFTELSIYSVMWSEHCSYKNSIKWLKTLPKDGEGMLAKAGEENAGLVDIGDGLACALGTQTTPKPAGSCAVLLKESVIMEMPSEFLPWAVKFFLTIVFKSIPWSMP